MAGNKKISQLDPNPSIDGTEEGAFEKAGVNVKESIENIRNWVGENSPYDFTSQVDVGGIRINDVVGPTQKDALDQLFSAPFVDMAFVYTLNFSLVEKGLSVMPSSTWNITPNDDIVTSVKLFRNSIEESDQGTTLSGSFPHVNAIGWMNTLGERTYQIQIQSDDAGLSSLNRVVSFVAPTYSGVLLDSEIDETNIKTLTKYIRNKADHNNISFSPTLQRYVYVYPKSFGLLTSIKDPNNFEVIASFDQSELTFTLADATMEDMYVYVSNADTTQVNFELDFIF